MNYSTRPDILELHEAFAARRAAVRDEFGGLDPAAFNWQPAGDGWSVAQCLDHLCQTGRNWADHLSPILFRSMRKGVHHRAPHRPGPIGRRAIGSMETVSRKFRAPDLFRPRSLDFFDPLDLLCAFDALGESWEATLRRACLVDLSKLVVGSPAAGWMRMPLGTWLYALSAHEDRHLEQARRVVAMDGFPA